MSEYSARRLEAGARYQLGDLWSDLLVLRTESRDPLNHEAAELFRKDVGQFERLVHRTLRGGVLDGVQFERLV